MRGTKKKKIKLHLTNFTAGPPLLQATKQIYLEALAIYYGMNKFEAEDIESLLSRLKTLSPPMILMLKPVRVFDFCDTGATMFTPAARVISKANMALRPVRTRMEDGTLHVRIAQHGRWIWTNGTTKEAEGAL